MTIIIRSSATPIAISVHCAVVKSGNRLRSSPGASKTGFRAEVRGLVAALASTLGLGGLTTSECAASVKEMRFDA
jgi:hypothetical protein